MNKTPLVSICCLTYNHAPYIRKCLDGFMMQKVDFPFEVLIHDDASTDGTQDIVREYEKKYPEIIKPIYQTENQYSKGVSISYSYQFSRAKGKYVALCEGDDYWIDSYKLQKQIKFLEENEEYYLVGMRNYIYMQLSGKLLIDKLCLHFKTSFRTSYYINNLLCHTSTFCFRRDFFYNPMLTNILQGDISLVLHNSNKGKYLIKVLKDFGTVYRVHNGGVTSSMKNNDLIISSKSLETIFHSYDKYSCYKDHWIIENKIKRDQLIMKCRQNGIKANIRSMKDVLFLFKIIINKCALVMEQSFIYAKLLFCRVLNSKLGFNTAMEEK